MKIPSRISTSLKVHIEIVKNKKKRIENSFQDFTVNSLEHLSKL